MTEQEMYDVSLDNCELFRAQIAEQAREIERIDAGAKKIATYAVSLEQELAALKAKPSGVVPDSVVWIDAHHIQPGNNPSFIRDVALVSAVKTTETQVPLVRLNHPASAGDAWNKRAALSANHSELVREVPSNCRQRLVAEGKAYPKSSCAVCGQFSPKWRECDAMLTAPSAGSQEQGE